MNSPTNSGRNAREFAEALRLAPLREEIARLCSALAVELPEERRADSPRELALLSGKLRDQEARLIKAGKKDDGAALRRPRLAADLLSTLRYIEEQCSRGALLPALTAALGIIEHAVIDPVESAGIEGPGVYFRALAAADARQFFSHAGGPDGPRCRGILDSLEEFLRRDPRLTIKELWNKFPDSPCGSMPYRDGDVLVDGEREISRASFPRYVKRARARLKDQ